MMDNDAYLNAVDDGLEMRETGSYVGNKYYYLSRYINIFETAMRDKWQNRTYIDLFSGPGKCIDIETNRVYIRSPLIAITTEFPFSKYYFVDCKKTYISALLKRCSFSPINNRIVTYIGDANKKVDTIVEQIKSVQGLNLALLDPEGFELEWSTINKLASIGKMDLIIYYPQMGINREMPKEIDIEKETKIDLFFGGREWREIYRSFQNKEDIFLHRNLLDLYKGKLQNIGYQEAKSIDEVENEPLIVNRNEAPLYRLIFASKHALGQDFWKKIAEKDHLGQKRLF
jgi:three-Cys-motif partner protein